MNEFNSSPRGSSADSNFRYSFNRDLSTDPLLDGSLSSSEEKVGHLSGVSSTTRVVCEDVREGVERRGIIWRFLKSVQETFRGIYNWAMSLGSTPTEVTSLSSSNITEETEQSVEDDHTQALQTLQKTVEDCNNPFIFKDVPQFRIERDIKKLEGANDRLNRMARERDNWSVNIDDAKESIRNAREAIKNKKDVFISGDRKVVSETKSIFEPSDKELASIRSELTKRHQSKENRKKTYSLPKEILNKKEWVKHPSSENISTALETAHAAIRLVEDSSLSCSKSDLKEAKDVEIFIKLAKQEAASAAVHQEGDDIKTRAMYAQRSIEYALNAYFIADKITHGELDPKYFLTLEDTPPQKRLVMRVCNFLTNF